MSVILMIVLALGYSLYFFAVRTFDTGSAQVEAQQKAKVVHEYFRSELRNTWELELLSNNSPNENDWGFFELEDKLLKKSTDSETIEISDRIEDIKIKVGSKGNERFVLEYEIISGVDEQEYTFSNQLLLNNINDPEEQIDGIDINGGFESLNENDKKLYYKDTPDD